jgi:hypothetical protein
MSHDGAVQLARRLRLHWLDRGFNIKTTIETITLGQRMIYGVRSNLVRGMPPADTKIAETEMDAAA